MRTLVVHIDGKKVGGVKNGASADFTVLPGAHMVRVSMDWTHSPDYPVALQPGDLVELRSKISGGWLSAFWRMLLAPDQMYEFDVVRHSS